MMTKEKVNRAEGQKATFSAVYGTRKADIHQEIGKEEAHQLMVSFLTNFPKTVHVVGLRKLKAKAMVVAMKTGVYESGNHRIEYQADKYLFLYSYRGTLIYGWDAYNDVTMELDAGAFDKTASTINQRREIQKAIADFKEALTKL